MDELEGKKKHLPFSPISIVGDLCDVGWLRGQEANFRRDFVSLEKEFIQRKKSGSGGLGAEGNCEFGSSGGFTESASSQQSSW